MGSSPDVVPPPYGYIAGSRRGKERRERWLWRNEVWLGGQRYHGHGPQALVSRPRWYHTRLRPSGVSSPAPAGRGHGATPERDSRRSSSTRSWPAAGTALMGSCSEGEERRPALPGRSGRRTPSAWGVLPMKDS